MGHHPSSLLVTSRENVNTTPHKKAPAIFLPIFCFSLSLAVFCVKTTTGQTTLSLIQLVIFIICMTRWCRRDGAHFSLVQQEQQGPSPITRARYFRKKGKHWCAAWDVWDSKVVTQNKLESVIVIDLLMYVRPSINDPLCRGPLLQERVAPI